MRTIQLSRKLSSKDIYYVVEARRMPYYKVFSFLFCIFLGGHAYGKIFIQRPSDGV